MNHRRIYVNGPIKREIISTAKNVEELVQEVRENLNFYRSTDMFERYLHNQTSTNTTPLSATEGPEHEVELELGCFDKRQELENMIQRHKDLKANMLKLYEAKQYLDEPSSDIPQKVIDALNVLPKECEQQPTEHLTKEYVDSEIKKIEQELDNIENCLAKNIPIPIEFYDNHLLKIFPEKYVFDDLPLTLFATPEGYFPAPYINKKFQKYFIAMLREYKYSYCDKSKELQLITNDNKNNESEINEKKDRDKEKEDKEDKEDKEKEKDKEEEEVKFVYNGNSVQETQNVETEKYKDGDKILNLIFENKNKSMFFYPAIGIINNTDYSFETTEVLEYSFDDVDIEIQNIVFKYHKYCRDNIVFYSRYYHTVIILNPSLLRETENIFGFKKSKPYGKFIDELEKDNDSWFERFILVSKMICETSGVQHKSILTDEIPNDYFCDFVLHSSKQQLATAIKENHLVFNHPKYPLDIPQEVLDEYKTNTKKRDMDIIAITPKVKDLMKRLLVIIKLNKTEQAFNDFYTEFKTLSLEEIFLLLNAMSSKYMLIHYAVFCANEYAIAFLLALYPVFINSGKEYYPLQLAVHRKKMRIVQLLLKYHPDINASNMRNRIALHYAARNGDCEMINLLLKYKSEINVYTYKDYKTPLIEASTVKAMELLVNHGASIEMNDFNYLYNRRSIDDVTVCKRMNFLLDWSEKKNKRYPSYILDSALSSVCDFSLYQYKDKYDYQCAVSLLNHGAEPNSPDISKRLTPLQYIVGTELREFNDIIFDFVKLLIQRKAVVELKDGCELTPLMWCVKRGDFRTAFLLAMAGAAFPETQLARLAARVSDEDQAEFKRLNEEFIAKSKREAAESHEGISKLIKELDTDKKKQKKKKKKQKKPEARIQEMKNDENNVTLQEKEDTQSPSLSIEEEDNDKLTNKNEVPVLREQKISEHIQAETKSVQEQSSLQNPTVINHEEQSNEFVLQQESECRTPSTVNNATLLDTTSEILEKDDSKGLSIQLDFTRNENNCLKEHTLEQITQSLSDGVTKSVKITTRSQISEEQLNELQALRLERERTTAMMKLLTEQFSALQDEINKKNEIIAQMKDLLVKAQEKVEKVEADAHAIQKYQKTLLNDVVIENKHLKSLLKQPDSQLQKYKELYFTEKERADKLAESLSLKARLESNTLALRQTREQCPMIPCSLRQQLSSQTASTLPLPKISDSLSSSAAALDDFFLIKHQQSPDALQDFEVYRNHSDDAEQEIADFAKPFSF